MSTDQENQKSSERMTNLEVELASLKGKLAQTDWEVKMAEVIKKGDLTAAVQIYQDYFDRRASMSEAAHHVMELKKKMGL